MYKWSLNTLMWYLVFLFLVGIRCNLSLVVTSNRIRLINLHNKCIPYTKAWDLQNKLVDDHILKQSEPMLTNPLAGSLLMLQHPPTYTLGTGTESQSGPFTGSVDGRELSFVTVPVDRAGQATYHGPGQLVMYPILDLNYFSQDINWYLRSLEQVVIDTLTSLDLQAGRVDGLTGVWTNGKSIDQLLSNQALNSVEVYKIAAIGIKIRRWVTLHGVAINVNSDMRYFDNIVPCGIKDKKVGNICQFRPQTTLNEVSELLLNNFKSVFKVDFDNGVDSVTDEGNSDIHKISECEWDKVDNNNRND